MNSVLSTEAFEALKRIQTLKELTRSTGFQTINEQNKILLSLTNADLLAIIPEVRKLGGAR
jgi:hypothetical protein